MIGRDLVNAACVGLLTIAAAVLPWRPPARRRPPNVLIVTLDTTRADRLAAYGASGIATPALDRLAREGVVFDHAMSVAPLTLTAHTSLFTGLYPPRHGVRDNAGRPLDASHATMAEILRGRGWRTAAFVGSTVLARDRGLARGFDVYDDGDRPGVPPRRRRPGAEVVDGAVAWLGSTPRPQPFLLWVHLYDVHAPQDVPAAYRTACADDGYAPGIAFVDAQLGRLVAALDARHLLDSTIVIATADHGESLGDHGEIEHGIFLYEGVLHIPLIVRSPFVRPRRIGAGVSLIDVLPTVLALVGLPNVPDDGVNLVPALRGSGPIPERSLYAESMYGLHFGWSALRTLRDGRFKYIDAPRPELYDLDSDPFEQHDLASERPAQLAAFHAGLAAAGGWLERSDADRSEVPTDVRGRLAALGYASGGPLATIGQGRDPKDYIQRYNEITRRRRSSR